jgi:hypothetical protein
MEKLNLKNEMKIGVEELLLGDVSVENRCGGFEVNGLTANHLSVIAQGRVIPFIEYIDLRIQQLINLQHQTAQPVISLDNRPILVTYGG